MKLRTLVRRAAQLRRDVVDGIGWTARRDRSILRRSITRRGEGVHVLVAPPGSGNIGDQAMVEAFVAAADRPVVIVTRGADDFVMPDDLAGTARAAVLPDLMYGSGRPHRRDVRTLGETLADAATLSFVGADIMDGVYNLRSALRRSTFAEAAALEGVPTTVIGFSWSPSARPMAARALRRAGAADVRLLLRDPESARRVRELGARNVIDVADIVFSDDRTDERAAREYIGDDGSPLAILNASGLISRTVDQVPEFLTVIADLRARGMRVLLLPHVLRSSSSDLAVAEAIAAAADDPAVTVVTRQLGPAEVRGLARRAQVVVTGRMHLAIIALAQLVPPVTLATQGKVEGLMQLFEAPELCVAPRPGMGVEILERVKSVLEDATLSDRLEAGLRVARRRSLINIAHISGNAAVTSRERS